MGNIRLSYKAGDRTEDPPAIVDENHYYPFGLKHTNYGFVPQQELAYAQKFNHREWQDEFNLNLTAMDFRQYDNALGRFYNPDRLAELTPGITPYRFAFNNPNYWSDPTGLFESWAAAQDFLNRMGRPGVIQAHDGYYSASYFIGDNEYFASMNDGYLSVTMTQQIEAVVITGTRSSSGGGGGGSSGGSGGFGGSGGGNKGYFANYFKDYFSYKRPAHANAYSPYIPDGTGFTISGTIGGFTVSISLVSGAAKTGVFLSTGGEFSLRESLFRGKVIGASATFDVYNNNGSSSLFEGIEGKNRTMSGSFMLFGSYSYPIDNGIRDINGVTKTSFGLGTYSVGYGGGYTWWLF